MPLHAEKTSNGQRSILHHDERLESFHDVNYEDGGSSDLSSSDEMPMSDNAVGDNGNANNAMNSSRVSNSTQTFSMPYRIRLNSGAAPSMVWREGGQPISPFPSPMGTPSRSENSLSESKVKVTEDENGRILRNPVWDSKIDWSRSTVELSSDEESLPNSSGSSVGLHEFSDDSSLELDVEDMRQSSQWELQALGNPHVPFRRRAQTLDVIPRARHHHHNRTRANTTQREESFMDSSITSMKSIRLGNRKVSPGRSLLFLFAIATYTTFWLPYPDLPPPQAPSDEFISAQSSQLYPTTVSSITNNNTTMDAVVPVEQHPSQRMKSNEEPVQPPQQATTVSRNLRKVPSNVAFARRGATRKEFRKLRQDEVADFYHQSAVVDQQHFILPWHVNVAILVSVAIWALVVDYSRRQKRKLEERNMTTLPTDNV